MSYTTLYLIQPNGDLETAAEYKNSHGFAPAIWTVITAKYVSNGMPLGDSTLEQRVTWSMQGRVSWLSYFSTPDSWRSMNALARAGKMSEHDMIAYFTTHDFIAVKVEDLLVVASAFEKFAEEYKEHFTGLVFHLPEMARMFRELYETREETGIRGICWNGTSCADTFAAGVPVVSSGGDEGEEELEMREYNFDLDHQHWWL